MNIRLLLWFECRRGSTACSGATPSCTCTWASMPPGCPPCLARPSPRSGRSSRTGRLASTRPATWCASRSRAAACVRGRNLLHMHVCMHMHNHVHVRARLVTVRTQVLVSVASLLDPSLAPEGGHVIHAYTPATEPYATWEQHARGAVLGAPQLVATHPASCSVSPAGPRLRPWVALRALEGAAVPGGSRATQSPVGGRGTGTTRPRPRLRTPCGVGHPGGRVSSGAARSTSARRRRRRPCCGKPSRGRSPTCGSAPR